MLLAYLLLALEAFFLLAIPPHFGFAFVREHSLYYPQGESCFAFAYGGLFVFQLLTIVVLIGRRYSTAALLSGVALFLALLTFNSTAYKLSFGEWLILAMRGLFFPSTFFSSVCGLLPIVTCVVLITISVQRFIAVNAKKSLSSP